MKLPRISKRAYLLLAVLFVTVCVWLNCIRQSRIYAIKAELEELQLACEWLDQDYSDGSLPHESIAGYADAVRIRALRKELDLLTGEFLGKLFSTPKRRVTR